MICLPTFPKNRALLAAAWLAAAAPAALAQGATHTLPEGQAIPDRYIVVFKPTVAHAAQEADRLVRAAGGQVHRRYTHALKGFAATLPAAALPGIRANPNVDAVEADHAIRLNQATSPQNQATWGLDRIDQRDRPLDTQYAFNHTGLGVTAFVIDTGIRADHAEFGGRVQGGHTEVADGNGTRDCNGHGTHVAGTLGGSTWGVAKAVQLVPVRVLDCSGSGTYSGVIAGIDWVAGTTARPAVANLSLGGVKSTTVNAAVAGASSLGVTMVVAAGNSNANACRYSPASEPTALTVGATTSSDARASYSNYGSCVDLFAPGSGITSAWHTSATATHTISGTSMASPHVAGIAALALSANPKATPAEVARFLLDNATPDRLASIGTGSPNRLAYSLAAGAPVAMPPQAVAVSGLTGTWRKVGKSWQAVATVSVRNVTTNTAVPHATVAGTFAPGGSASCVTSSDGSCSMASGSLASTVTLSDFTVDGITGSGLDYDASQNSATRITISR
ncbi:S8 family peptidase [Ramlibacter sp. MAHUQ-53]|uniref:S8 family peptidase n=1 Tax=unclassified Ramlibacter TaxID=2617605 RepID=UPI003634F8A4